MYFVGGNMLNTIFENIFSNCLNGKRNLCVLLKDAVNDELVDNLSLMMKTVAPQHSVSVFEFNAIGDELDEATVSKSMAERIRNFSSAIALDEGRKPNSVIYFAASILEESIIVIYNAENVTDEFYQSIEKVERALRISGKGRLRFLLIGNDSVVPLVAKNTKSINRVKWYNLLKEPEPVNEMLNSVVNAINSHQQVTGEVEDELIVFGRML